MLGLDALIAMRRRGVRPDRVFLEPQPCDVRLSSPSAEWLTVQPGETPARADLRALTKLTVIVIGTALPELIDWARACANAGARNVFIKWTEKGSFMTQPMVRFRVDDVNVEDLH